MKKIIIVIIAFAIISSSAVQAQKLKKESLGDYKYTQLPIDASLVGLKTYKVIGLGNEYGPNGITRLEKAIDLIGFEEKDKMTTNPVDFEISVEKFPVTFTKRELKSKVKTTKKDGVEVKNTWYHYVATAKYNFVLRINKGGEVIFKTANAGEEKVVGKEFKSSPNALSNFRTTKQNYRSSLVEKKVGALNAEVNDKFCFPVKKLHVRSAHIKPKKHNYDDYEKIFLDMKAGYDVVKIDENNIDGAKESLNKAIEGFETLLKESDTGNKKARINHDITAALFLNIGHCYLFMKDYAKANEYYKKGFALKKMLFGATTLVSVSENMQKRVEANK